MKILINALSGIGDALMFTPALKLLRQSFPDAQIDALVMFNGVKDIYERNENINSVFYFNFINEGAFKSLLYLLKFTGKYDVTINVYPSNRKEYNIFSFLLAAKKRLSVKYNRMDKENLGFLNNLRITENDNLHNVIHNIQLIEKLSGNTFNKFPDLHFHLTEEDENYAEGFLKNNKIDDEALVIGFHAGCSTLKNHINRRWEPEKFAELGKLLIENHRSKILLFGGPEEKELKTGIKSRINSDDVMLVETQNLAQSAAIMKRCNLFITNDSSLLHVSSSQKLNVIALIGPTNKDFIHPWNTNYKIASLDLECSPCFFYSPKPLECYRDDVKYKCIKELTVNYVYIKAVEFLNEFKNK